MAPLPRKMPEKCLKMPEKPLIQKSGCFQIPPFMPPPFAILWAKDPAVLKILCDNKFTMRSKSTIAQWFTIATPLRGHHFPRFLQASPSQRRVHSVVDMGGVVKTLRWSNSLSRNVFSTVRSFGWWCASTFLQSSSSPGVKDPKACPNQEQKIIPKTKCWAGCPCRHPLSGPILRDIAILSLLTGRQTGVGFKPGGGSWSGLVLPFLSFFCPFWDSPDFSGIFPNCSGMVRGFSRFVLFLVLGLGTVPKGSTTQSGPFPKKWETPGFGNPPV